MSLRSGLFALRAALLAGAAIFCLGLTCAPPPGEGTDNTNPPPEPVVQPKITLETTQGRIVIELFPVQAPLAVANFLRYVEDRFYEGTIVHEVVRDSYLIAGAFDADLQRRATRDPIANESNNGLTNIRGRVAVFEPSGTGSGTSQILINLADNPDRDFDLETGKRGLTVFGRVVGGLDVADQIGGLSTSRKTAQDGTPLNNIPTNTVQVVQAFDSTNTDEPTSGPNRPPVADAGAAQTVLAGGTVTLDGSASSDPDPDDSLSFNWIQTSGPTVTLSSTGAAQPTFGGDAAGTFTFELTVIDRFGATASATTAVTINTPTDRAPVANAGPDQTHLVNAIVTLDGSASSDPDAGDALNYQWAQLGGTVVTLSSAAAAKPTFTAPSNSDTLTFRLTVTDGEGAVATDLVLIHSNTSPAANAGTDRIVPPGIVARLRGNGSSDSDTGDVLTYAWSQTAGTSVNLSASDVAEPTFVVPETAGDLAFSLTVTDGRGGSSTDAVTLTVKADPNVRLHTSMGEIVLDMLTAGAPITTTNFYQYVDDGFYDGTIFHRVVNTPKPFVVQGGAFLPGLERQAGARDPIQNEFSADRSNVRATVAMAKISGDTDSATSQFFFNLSDNSGNLDGQNGGFTVFARVTEGMETVVDEMAKVATETRQGPTGATFSNVPVQDILLINATIE